MKARELLEALSVAERLKDATRHCYTKNGRHESVTEHSWMMTLMAFLIKDEFPDADIDKVIKMCIIHDLGEAFTGDIPTFDKTKENEITMSLTKPMQMIKLHFQNISYFYGKKSVKIP